MTNLQQIIKEKQEQFAEEIGYCTRTECVDLQAIKHFIFSDYTKSILAGVREWAEKNKVSLDVESSSDFINADSLQAFLNQTNPLEK